MAIVVIVAAEATMSDNASMGTTSAALVVRDESEFRRGLEPVDLGTAHKVAVSLAQSGLYGVAGPEDALARIMTGRELGLSCMQSMRGLYNVEGKIGIDASLMHALCLQSSMCEMFECTFESDERVEYTIRRKGWTNPQKITWSLQDAARAGLVNRGSDPKQNNWNKYPRQMMHARCKADGARRVFPEKLFGLYTAQELADGAVIDMGSQSSKTVDVSDAQAVAQVSSAHDELEKLEKRFIAHIEAAKTDQDRSMLRANLKKAVEAGELRGPSEERVRAAYAAKWPTKPAQRTAAAAPAQPAAPDLGTAPTEYPPTSGE